MKEIDEDGYGEIDDYCVATEISQFLMLSPSDMELCNRLFFILWSV